MSAVTNVTNGFSKVSFNADGLSTILFGLRFGLGRSIKCHSGNLIKHHFDSISYYHTNTSSGSYFLTFSLPFMNVDTIHRQPFILESWLQLAQTGTVKIGWLRWDLLYRSWRAGRLTRYLFRLYYAFHIWKEWLYVTNRSETRWVSLTYFPTGQWRILQASQSLSK